MGAVLRDRQVLKCTAPKITLREVGLGDTYMCIYVFLGTSRRHNTYIAYNIGYIGPETPQ